MSDAEVSTQVNVAMELCRAAQAWPSDNEDADTFIERLVPAVNALSEAEFMGMPKEAQDWQDEAVECKNNNLPPPDLPGFDEVVALNGAEKPAPRVAAPEDDDDEEDDEEVEGEDAPPKKKAKKRASRAKKTDGERKTRMLSGTGKVSGIANAMIDNPDATVEEIRKKLIDQGLEASQSVVPTFRSAFRNFLSVLHKRGNLKGLSIKY